MKKADMVVNGKIYTADKNQSIAEAFAVSDGKIIFVGDKKEAEKYIDDNTKVVTYTDGVVIPGITEGHAHISCTTELIFGVCLQDCETVDEYKKAISDYVSSHPDEEVITGGGFENGVFDEIGPTAKIIDGVVKDKPVILVSADHHSSWVNSKAMELVHLDENTPDVESGVIVRYKNSKKPTGWLKEMAQGLMMDIVPKLTAEQFKKALLHYQNIALQNGVTIAFEPMLDHQKEFEKRFKAYEELAKEDKLKVTFRVAYTIEPDDDADEIFKQAIDTRERLNKYEHINVNTIKLFVDGVVEGHTAYLRDDYKDAEGDKGEPMYPQEDVNKYVLRALKEGFRVHTHAIGDAAIDSILEAYEKGQNAVDSNNFRNAITHLQVMQQDQVEKMKELGIVAVVNPYWHFKNPVYYNNLEVPYLGEERASKEYLLGSLKKKGIVMSQASDFPVTVPPRTMDSLHIMVNRVEPGKKDMEPLGIEEAISVKDALDVLTIGGAYQNDLDEKKGSIEAGKDADFVVLDKDVFTMPKEELYKTNVVKTFTKGVLAWKE